MEILMAPLLIVMPLVAWAPSELCPESGGLLWVSMTFRRAEAHQEIGTILLSPGLVALFSATRILRWMPSAGKPLGCRTGSCNAVSSTLPYPGLVPGSFPILAGLAAPNNGVSLSALLSALPGTHGSDGSGVWLYRPPPQNSSALCLNLFRNLLA